MKQTPATDHPVYVESALENCLYTKELLNQLYTMLQEQPQTLEAGQAQNSICHAAVVQAIDYLTDTIDDLQPAD